MKPIISLHNVSVVYNQGEAAESTALSNVSLEIFDGEYIVFFGPSGCGKSTLLYTIAGLETPTSGTVVVADQNLQSISEGDMIEFYRTTIGMVFQAFYLVPHLSAKDNLMLSKMFSGVSKEEREKKADELCLRFGISSFADRKPSMMSGGQQQRTAIARALMNEPHIILADEPVGNLDSKNAEIVLELLADIHRKEKKTVIQVTHNPKDIHYADRVFYMKDGAIERVVLQEPDKEKPVLSQTKAVEFMKTQNLLEAPHRPVNTLDSSHVILQALVSSYHGHLKPHQTQLIHECIKERISGALSQEAMQTRFDISLKEGGVGLNRRTALHFAERVQAMLS